MKVTLRDRHGHKIVAVPCAVKRGKPVVILVHGLSSQKGRFRTWATALKKQGIGSLRIDVYGHGESDGSLLTLTAGEMIASAQAAYKYVVKLGAGPVGMAGSSMGGMVSLLYASANPKIKALCLIAPLSNFKRSHSAKDPRSNVDEWKKQGWVWYVGKYRAKLGYKYYESGIKSNVFQKARALRIPILIFHGTKDNRIAIEDSESLAKATGGTLVRVPGMGHVFRTWKPAIRRRVQKRQTKWLKQQLAA